MKYFKNLNPIYLELVSVLEMWNLNQNRDLGPISNLYFRKL